MSVHPLGPEYALTRLTRVEQEPDDVIPSKVPTVRAQPTWWYDLEVSNDCGETWKTLCTMRATSEEPMCIIKHEGPAVTYRASILITEAQQGPRKTRRVY